MSILFNLIFFCVTFRCGLFGSVIGSRSVLDDVLEEEEEDEDPEIVVEASGESGHPPRWGGLNTLALPVPSFGLQMPAPRQQPQVHIQPSTPELDQPDPEARRMSRQSHQSDTSMSSQESHD